MLIDKDSKLNKYYYFGAIHIHSNLSDGSGDIYEISKAAKDAGLDWIMITDHNNFDIEEGIFNGVCVIRGEEISPHGKNHCLALGTNKLITPSDNIQNCLDEIRHQGGFSIAAHPDELENRKNENAPIRWTDKSVIPDGVEIWNWFSNWADNLNDRNLFTLANSFFFKNKLVKVAPPDSIKWWDELNNNSEKIFPAIGGVDAHALKIRKGFIPVTVFPYKPMFKTIANVISLESPLANDFATQKKQILKAIRNGNNLIVNQNIIKKLPHINISNSACHVTSGESIQLDNETYLNVNFEKKLLIKVFLNGKKLQEVNSSAYKLQLTETGKYRVELFIKDTGGVYSNPIIVY